MTYKKLLEQQQVDSILKKKLILDQVIYSYSFFQIKKLKICEYKFLNLGSYSNNTTIDSTVYSKKGLGNGFVS